MSAEPLDLKAIEALAHNLRVDDECQTNLRTSECEVAADQIERLCSEVRRLRERIAQLEAPRLFEKVDELALALRVLEDHDMLEEAEKLQRRSLPFGGGTPE